MGKGGLTIAVAGEAMATRPFSMYDEPEFTAILELLRKADVSYAHLETNIGDINEINWAAKGEHKGSFFMSEPRIADDLKWAGIDIVSAAHNHCGDYGASGMLSTRRQCKRAGLACAGIGPDLETARAPEYLETKKGRIALVSMTSGSPSTDWASLAKGGTKGRPGVNPLRATIKFVLDRESATQIKEIGNKLKVIRPTGEDGEFALGWTNMGGVTNIFTSGEKCEVTSEVHEKDLERNCRSINEAKNMADLVLVAHHCNFSEGPRGNDPPKFMQKAAKAFIDSGADMYFGHGWHRTLGIEVYKNKPIFYGLGNFFAQSEFVKNVPYDAYESWGCDMDQFSTLTPKDIQQRKQTSAETWWSSVITEVCMEDRQVVKMKFYPIEMGRDASPEMTLRRRTGDGPRHFTEGRPMMADKKSGKRILERIQQLSAQYGTKIEIENGYGIFSVK